MRFEAVMEKGAIDKLKALSEKVNGRQVTDYD